MWGVTGWRLTGQFSHIARQSWEPVGGERRRGFQPLPQVSSHLGPRSISQRLKGGDQGPPSAPPTLTAGGEGHASLRVAASTQVITTSLSWEPLRLSPTQQGSFSAHRNTSCVQGGNAFRLCLSGTHQLPCHGAADQLLAASLTVSRLPSGHLEPPPRLVVPVGIQSGFWDLRHWPPPHLWAFLGPGRAPAPQRPQWVLASGQAGW